LFGVGVEENLDISRGASSGNGTYAMTTPCDFLFETVVAGPAVLVITIFGLGEGEGKVDYAGCGWREKIRDIGEGS
jgi:hypothetical protein